jgi:hypothetical protein
MYKFDEQALRKGINIGLGSQGIWTPELEDVMFNEITNEALRIHDVVGRIEKLVCNECNFVELQDHIYQCTKCYKVEDRLAN